MKNIEGKIYLRAFGDNLIHKQIYKAAETGDGSYCFDSLYEHVKKFINDCDISVINQETVLVKDKKSISAFPSFGSPYQVADAIKKAGFSVVTHASNHVLDKKIQGICESLEKWKDISDVTVLGIHKSKEDYDKIRIIEKNGIKIAMLNFTQSLNFHTVPKKYKFILDVMKPYSKGRIRSQIRQAKQMADFVIVFPHWGCEYLYEPVKKQTKWAKLFADEGADLIIGTHPHVLQNIEVITSSDGRDVPCLYSLGNFVSCQIKPGTMLGGMADIVIERDASGLVNVSDYRIVPLVTHTDGTYSYFTVYPLDEYNDELASENKIFKAEENNYGFKIDMNYLKKLYDDILNKKAQEYNIYKSPLDVKISNIKGVISTIRGVDKKK